MLIGIPRALGYYYYSGLWERFFSHLGIPIVVSGSTRRDTLATGICLTPAEACLPLKCFVGHVASLVGTCDRIFIPRLVCMEAKTRNKLGCPKLIALPDMVRAILPQAPLLTIDIDERHFPWKDSFASLSSSFGLSPARVRQAFLSARSDNQADHVRPVQEKRPAKPLIGLLGHAYSLDDALLGLEIPRKLSALGCHTVSCHDVPHSRLSPWLSRISPVSWYFEERILCAAACFLHDAEVDGVVQLLNFGCGAGSIVSEIIDLEIRKSSSVPLLRITVDEHTGEAGVATRLESFVDMIRMRGERGR